MQDKIPGSFLTQITENGGDQRIIKKFENYVTEKSEALKIRSCFMQIIINRLLPYANSLKHRFFAAKDIKTVSKTTKQAWSCWDRHLLQKTF